MRRRLHWFLLTVLAVGVAVRPPAVRAAEEHGPAAAGGAHGEHGEKPPLLSFDPGAAVWSIVVFVILLAVLRKFAWRPILEGLQQREKFIHDSIEEAKHQQQEAEATLKRYMEQINHAREEATAIVEEGRRDAEAVRKRMHEEARAEAHALVERAKRDLAIARDDAIKALYRQSVELSTEIAGKLVKKQLTPQDQQSLIDEALTEIGNMRR
jgi:F-type H+-transporting ATPase subunit b